MFKYLIGNVKYLFRRRISLLTLIDNTTKYIQSLVYMQDVGFYHLR